LLVSSVLATLAPLKLMDMESAYWKSNRVSHCSSCEGSHIKGLRERPLGVTEELPGLGMGGVLGACNHP